MTKKLPSESIQYYTSDLGCATALVSVGHNIIGLDKEDPRRIGFIFHSDKNLEKAVDDYFADRLLVNARTYFDNLRMVKNRIYRQ